MHRTVDSRDVCDYRLKVECKMPLSDFSSNKRFLFYSHRLWIIHLMICCYKVPRLYLVTCLLDDKFFVNCWLFCRRQLHTVRWNSCLKTSITFYNSHGNQVIMHTMLRTGRFSYRYMQFSGICKVKLSDQSTRNLVHLITREDAKVRKKKKRLQLIGHEQVK